MSREQRIVDTETGEILSSRKIKPNANFVQFYRNEIGSIRELIKDEQKQLVFSFSCLKKWTKKTPL